MGVLGMGGFFFRAKDPDALTAWYREHLNIGVGCNAEGTGDPDDWFWQTQGGPMVFAPDANQGPLLGIFITGPLGTLLGAIGGFVYAKSQR